jgi:hypothetical protein
VRVCVPCQPSRVGCQESMTTPREDLTKELLYQRPLYVYPETWRNHKKGQRQSRHKAFNNHPSNVISLFSSPTTIAAPYPTLSLLSSHLVVPLLLFDIVIVIVLKRASATIIINNPSSGQLYLRTAPTSNNVLWTQTLFSYSCLYNSFPHDLRPAPSLSRITNSSRNHRIIHSDNLHPIQEKLRTPVSPY